MSIILIENIHGARIWGIQNEPVKLNVYLNNIHKHIINTIVK